MQVDVFTVTAAELSMPPAGETLAAEDAFEDLIRLHALANQHLAEAIADLNVTHEELNRASSLGTSMSELNTTGVTTNTTQLEAMQAAHAAATQHLAAVVAGHADLQAKFDQALQAREATRLEIARARAVDLLASQRLASAQVELQHYRNSTQTQEEASQRRVEEAAAAQREAKEQVAAALLAHSETFELLQRAKGTQEVAELELMSLTTELMNLRQELWFTSAAHNGTRAELERIKIDLAAERWRHGQTQQSLRREIESHKSTHEELSAERSANAETQQALGLVVALFTIALVLTCGLVVCLLNRRTTVLRPDQLAALGQGGTAPIVVVGRPVPVSLPPATVCTAQCRGSTNSPSLQECPPPPGCIVGGYAFEHGRSQGAGFALGEGMRPNSSSSLRSAGRECSLEDGALPGEILT